MKPFVADSNYLENRIKIWAIETDDSKKQYTDALLAEIVRIHVNEYRQIMKSKFGAIEHYFSGEMFFTSEKKVMDAVEFIENARLANILAGVDGTPYDSNPLSEEHKFDDEFCDFECNKCKRYGSDCTYTEGEEI